MRSMEKFIRNVAELDTADRRAIEHLIGEPLAEQQQVIISVVNLDRAWRDESPTPELGEIPAWWNIYEGLSNEGVERLDQAVRQRANLNRVFG